jgi:hypothetical protein
MNGYGISFWPRRLEMVEFVTVEAREQLGKAMSQRASELPAPVIDGVENGRINLIQMQNGLVVRLPHIDGQQVGDRYYVIVGVEDSMGGWGLDGSIDSAEGDTLVTIPADRALNFRGQSLVLGYFYLEIENPTSPSTRYFAEDEIYRPVVDEAENGIIPLAAVDLGVNVRLRASKALSDGALVSFYWYGTACEGSYVSHFRIQSSDEGKDVVFGIAPRFLRPNKYGTVQLIYTVENAGRKWTTSLIELEVEGNLEVPEPVYGSQGHYVPGQLDLIDEGGRIPMTLSTHGMSVGDVVTFVFSGAMIGTSYVWRQILESHHIGEDLLINVPLLHAQLGPSVRALGIVERKTGEVVGTPLLRLQLPMPD